MSEDTSVTAQTQSREKWNQARRRAFYQRLSSALGLTKQPVSLLSFEDVQQKLRLNQNAYRGLQQVPLSQIVGSVGRYHDFTRTFLPLVEGDGQRWRRVAELQYESGLPPIELYKVGEAYFVKDGNHRVSVARQFGMETIEAYVWEYQTPVGGMSAEAELDELIVKAEYRAFLDKTELDITQRRHAEEELRLSEERFSRIVEISADAIVTIDDQQRTPLIGPFLVSPPSACSVGPAVTAWLDATGPDVDERRSPVRQLEAARPRVGREVRMVENMDESFLIAHDWEKVRRRMDSGKSGRSETTP